MWRRRLGRVVIREKKKRGRHLKGWNGRRLALGHDFGRAAADAVLDLTGDDDAELRRQRSLTKWDRKKKKFVGQEENSKTRKIRTESGVWIPATYKTDRYQRWRDKSKVSAAADADGYAPTPNPIRPDPT